MKKPNLRQVALALLALSVVAILPVGARADGPIAVRPVPIPRSQLLEIHSAALNRTYDLQVKLPPSYSAPTAATRRYPVLYLNDATYNFQVAAGITHAPMNFATLEEFIIVGIGYSHGSEKDSSRVRDYTPSRNPKFKQETGGAGDYMKFVEREVIPLIESTYRTDPRRRAYAGHSFGGLFGAYVLLNRPEMFRYYILSSPSFWFHEHVMWSHEAAAAKGRRDLPADVYISIGELEHPRRPSGAEYDMVADVRTFERMLVARGYPSLRLRVGIVSGATHETSFPTTLMNGLLWHFALRRDIPYGY